VNGRAEAAGLCRAGRRLLVAIALLVIAAAGAAACGGSSSSDLGPYLGAWQRVEAGAPNPDVTLTVTRRDAAATVTFANLSSGAGETVAASAEDGYLVCTLLSAAAGPQPSPGQAPPQMDLQLSLDDNGQLVVDLVLADGTLEPVWIYERAAAPSPDEP
jgi:hypothetical protein